MLAGSRLSISALRSAGRFSAASFEPNWAIVRRMGNMASAQGAAPDRVAEASGEQATFGAGCYCMSTVHCIYNFLFQ